LLRPYIGSCHNRHYIHNRLPSSSLLSNDSFFSTSLLSKSFLPTQSIQRNYLTKLVPTQIQEEERVPIEYLSSPIQSDERRQLHEEQKAKGFLSSSSSSLFFFPTTHNVTSLTRSDLIPYSSFNKEQQKIRHDRQYSDWQLLNTENKNNQSLLSEQLEKHQQKQSSDHNHHFGVNDLTEETSSLSKTSNNIFDLSTSRHSTDHQRKAGVCHLNNMSALQYSSGLGTGSTTHYDQRISDQGNKYIIQLKTDDYQENEFTITPHLSSHQLIIDAKHNEEDNLGGYIRRELHKIFTIPKHIDLNKHIYSYNKKTQELTIEIPYLQTTATDESKNNSSSISPNQNTTQSLTFSYGNLDLNNRGGSLSTISSRPDYQNVNNPGGINTAVNGSTTNPIVAPSYISSIGTSKPFDFDRFHQSVFRPQIVQAASNEYNNDKKLIMSLDLTDYQPEDIKVSIKDQELIVKAERKIETDTRKSRTSFFQSTSLPPQTDIEHLQTNYIDGKLVIEAPYLDRRIKTSNNQGTNE
jgi:HSP20 family molecular chaperone IbpA